MDWISKLEKEKKEEEQARARFEKEKAEALRKEEATFSIVKGKLCPLIKSTITELNDRVGIQLTLHQDAASIEVTKRGKNDDRLVHHHRLIISKPSADGRSVLVTAIQARESHRPELDDVDKSDWSGNKYAEMYGRDETIVKASADLNDLLESDLHLLMEWLAKTESYDKLALPQIKAVLNQIEQNNVVSAQKKERKDYSRQFRFLMFGSLYAIGGFVIGAIPYGIIHEIFGLPVVFLWIWVVICFLIGGFSFMEG